MHCSSYKCVSFQNKERGKLFRCTLIKPCYQSSRLYYLERRSWFAPHDTVQQKSNIHSDELILTFTVVERPLSSGLQMDVTYIHTLMNQLFYIHLLYNTGKHCYEKHHEAIFLITEIICLHFLQSWIIQNWSEEQTRQQCLDKQ